MATPTRTKRDASAADVAFMNDTGIKKKPRACRNNSVEEQVRHAIKDSLKGLTPRQIDGVEVEGP
eukprot:1452054-Amphidinium_carterae.1